MTATIGLDALAGMLKRQAYMQWLGVEPIEVGAGHVTLAVNVRPDMLQHGGSVHAGVISGLADNACGGAVATLTLPQAAPVTSEFKINLLNPALGQRLIAKARVIKTGKRLLVASAEVFVDAASEPCAVLLGSFVPLPLGSTQPQ